ncbi:MAG: hypothetical protein GY788_14990 [bacterium]|nr:hypothetical protein [bacterium]
MRALSRLVWPVLVIALAAAACGDSEPSNETTTTAAPGDATATSEATTDTTEAMTEPTEAIGVTMVLWPGPEGDAMQQVVDVYNAGQGVEDGVNVEMVLLSRDDTFARELTEIAANSSAVDLYFTASYNVGQFANGLAPISDIDFDQSVYFPAALESLQVGGSSMHCLLMSPITSCITEPI